MRGRSLTALALLLFGLTEAASQASDETYADVLFVRATKTEASVWRFDVTVSHADTGWDNYANRWLVFASGSNQMLGERVLLHPHVAEQPFTRSLSGITIARHITRVTVAARTSVTQFGGRQIVLDLLQGGGERFEIVRQAAKPDVEVTPR